MNKSTTLSPMKFVATAIKRCGGTPNALQRELVRVGVNVSVEALRKAAGSGKESLRLDVLAGIVEVSFDGDWEAAGKLLRQEFMPEK